MDKRDLGFMFLMASLVFYSKAYDCPFILKMVAGFCLGYGIAQIHIYWRS